MTMSLARRLGAETSCVVSDDPLILSYCSADASSFTARPEAVAFPEDSSDVQDVVRFAARHRIPVTARGAGTGLVGGALGSGIIIDFGRMSLVEVGRDVITVQPGTIKGILDDTLEKSGRFFSPDPSVGRYCMLGGMIGTNASGSHALKYGSIIDNILSATIVCGDGRIITLPDCASISNMIASVASEADITAYPRTTKNSCGYRLDAVGNASQAHRIIAGSEGTLGLVVSATFMTWKAPACRILTALSYRRIDDMRRDICSIMRQGPAAIEYMDRYTMGNMPHDFGNATHALLVEFDDNDGPCGRLSRDQVRGGIEFESSDADNIKRWWQCRSSALSHAIRGTGGAARGAGAGGAHLMEDAAVPAPALGGLFSAIRRTARRYGAGSIIYGHAGNANLHTRLRRRRPMPVAAYREFFGDVWKMCGTITAEHGDGMARTRFVRRQYGEKNYRLFARLKNMMDPSGILNPGKIVSCSAGRTSR